MSFIQLRRESKLNYVIVKSFCKESKVAMNQSEQFVEIECLSFNYFRESKLNCVVMKSFYKEQNRDELERAIYRNRMSSFELKSVKKQSNETTKCNDIKTIYRRTLIDKKEILDVERLCIIETLRATNEKRK